MAEKDTKDCPFCAEPVRGQASVCPHCRSPLGGPVSPEAYRNRPGSQIAGVSMALAEAFGISVTFVRLLFVVLTFVSFIGPVVYVALWLLIPAEPGGLSPLGQLVTGEEGEPSILERLIQETRVLFDRLVAWFRSTPPKDGEHPTEGAP